MRDLRLGAFGLEFRVFRGSGFRVKGFRVCWGVQKTSGIERKLSASKRRLVEMGAAWNSAWELVKGNYRWGV